MCTDVQRFDSDGTWVKPDGALRLTVSLKGGTGDNALLGLRAFPDIVTYGGGGGGGAAVAGAGGTGGGNAIAPAGGGGSAAAVSMNMGTVARAPEWNVTPGEESQLVEFSFAADEVPDRMDIKIGRGGWAEIVTDLNG